MQERVPLAEFFLRLGNFIGDRIFAVLTQCLHKIIELARVVIIVIERVGEKGISLILRSEIAMVVVMVTVSVIVIVSAAALVGMSFMK